MVENSNEKTLVTGISVEKGIISVIDPEGNIRMYRHPLVEAMPIGDVQQKMADGVLSENLFDYHAFPTCWEIETEEPEITGDLATMLDSL